MLNHIQPPPLEQDQVMGEKDKRSFSSQEPLFYPEMIIATENKKYLYKLVECISPERTEELHKIGLHPVIDLPSNMPTQLNKKSEKKWAEYKINIIDTKDEYYACQGCYDAQIACEREFVIRKCTRCIRRHIACNKRYRKESSSMSKKRTREASLGGTQSCQKQKK